MTHICPKYILSYLILYQGATNILLREKTCSSQCNRERPSSGMAVQLSLHPDTHVCLFSTHIFVSLHPDAIVCLFVVNLYHCCFSHLLLSEERVPNTSYSSSEAFVHLGSIQMYPPLFQRSHIFVECPPTSCRRSSVEE